jgi:hypothetical protein
MANTKTKINTYNVTSDIQIVSFTSIPSTYTDLLLEANIRTSVGGGAFATVYVNFNNDYSSIYSYTYLQGFSNAVYSSRSSSQGGAAVMIMNTSTATSNTFGSNQLYVTNYAGTTFKAATATTSCPTNTSNYEAWQAAMLYRSTAAVTSVYMDSYNSSIKFTAGSTFTLYGIKNSA